MAVFLVANKGIQMRKLKKNAMRVLEMFGEDELKVYQNFKPKERTSYIAVYYRHRGINAKVYAPSEWLRSRRNGIAVHHETAKMILDIFSVSELECYQKWSYRDRQSYNSYLSQLRMKDKEIKPKDCPSSWHERLLEKRAKCPNLAGHGTKKSREKEAQSINEIEKRFREQIIELFSILEWEFFENMIAFAKKYYKQHALRSLKKGFRVKKPSQWYIQFIATTQCVEMLRLQKRFFALVKAQISKEDAKEYIAYFENRAYQRERNYCL